MENYIVQDLAFKPIPEIIHFQAFGKPATQGSKKVVPIIKAGKPVMKNGRVLTRAVEDNPKTAEWRQEIAHACRSSYGGPLLVGPVSLAIEFVRPRPKNHFCGGKKNAGKLRSDAPAYPIQRPDTVKLTRAVEDALTGVLWKDDSQVVEHCLSKRWGDCFCVSVTVMVMDLEGENELRRMRGASFVLTQEPR